MSNAHKGSRLIMSGNVIPVDSNCVALFHYDITENDVIYGIAPISNITTLRPYEGYYGGGIAIEEATTNMLSGSSLTFNWGGYSGANVTLTQNYPFPEYGATDATRFQTSGGTDTLKSVYQIMCSGISGTALASQVKVKNIGTGNFIVRNQYGGSNVVSPNQVQLVQQSAVFNGSSCYQLRFETPNINDALDLILYQPQAEKKAFSTSFVNGTRNSGSLYYPANILNPQAGTINCWIYVDPSGAHSSSTTWAMGYSIVQIVSSPSYAELNQISLRKYASSTEWRFVTSDNNGATTSYSVGSPSKGWHMFTFTWGNGTGNGYLDGVLISTISSANLPSTFANAYSNSFIVGSWTSGDYLNSIIDELRIDNITRASEEIISWYISQRPFYPKGIYTVAY